MSSNPPKLVAFSAEDENEQAPYQCLQFPCGSWVVYGGDDGVVSLWKSNDEVSVLRTWDDASVRALAVASDGKRVAVGLANGQTEIFYYPDYSVSDGGNMIHPFCKPVDDDDEDDTLKWAGPTSSGAIRQLLFAGPRQLFVASESSVRLVDATSSSSSGSSFQWDRAAQEAHDGGGVRGIALSKDGSYAATLGLDGRLCLWKEKDNQEWALVRREATTCAPSDVGDEFGAIPADQVARPVLYMADDHVWAATPGQAGIGVRPIQGSSTWEVHGGSDSEGHLEPVTCMLPLISDSAKMVTGGRDGKVVLWELDAEKKVWKAIKSLVSELTSPVVHIAADRKNVDQIRLITAHGKAFSLIPVAFEPKAGANSTEKGAKETSSETVFEDSDDEGEDGGKENKNEDEFLRKKSVRFVDDEAAQEDDGIELNDDLDYPLDPTAIHDDMEDDVMGGLNSQAVSRQFSSNWKPPALQAPFVPSSSPQVEELDEDDSDMKRRFLCWNHVGSMIWMQGDPTHTVDIMFTDSAFQRPVSISDTQTFVVGSLGEDGAILCTDWKKMTDDDTPAALGRTPRDPSARLSEEVQAMGFSRRIQEAVRHEQEATAGSSSSILGSLVYFYRFAPVVGKMQDKDWAVRLPHGERAVSVAAGAGWAAVGTQHNWIRFYSSGGVPGPIVALPGPMLTMAGRDQWLVAIYHKGPPISGTSPQLGVILYDGATAEVLADGSGPILSANASLAWAGLDHEGSVVLVDSEGRGFLWGSGCISTSTNVISLRGPTSWFPIVSPTADEKTGATSRIWPVTIRPGKLVGVPLPPGRGKKSYPPATARRPVTTVVSFRMPLASPSAAASVQLEDLSIRTQISLAQSQRLLLSDENHGEDELAGLSSQTDKVTIKLIHSHLTIGKLDRALDVVPRLHSDTSYDIVLQISDRLRLPHAWADKVEEMRDAKFGNAFPDDGSGGEPYSVPLNTGVRDTMTQVSPDAHSLAGNQLSKRPLFESFDKRKRSRVGMP